MYFSRNATIAFFVLLLALALLDVWIYGEYSKWVKWLFAMGFFLIPASAAWVSHRWKCKACGKKALSVDDGTFFGKRNYFARRCMHCDAPLKGQ
ncbi:hypothetical protein EII18_00090 [Comamonadaceae bacterium OH3737_COT-264]|nr:hypothetical protein EII18_00090 [Comamonadaceae bacterium OH3737_COT-264]